MEQAQELLRRLHGLVEAGAEVADALVRVGVGAAGAGLAQHLGDLQGEVVLAGRVAAVQHLDGVDELEDGQLRRLLGGEGEGLLALALEVDGVEVVAEGVGDDEVGALLVGDFAEAFEAADAALVAAQADGDDVAHVGGDLHAVGDEGLGVGLAEGVEVPVLPHAVVLGDVDAGEADAVGLGDEVLGIEHGIGGPARGVQVHIDDGAGHARLRARAREGERAAHRTGRPA